jgi:hypothetical protein
MSLFVEVYSEKAIVLRGAQEQHRSILEANKGMFNARLKGGSGWIFPKFMKNQIEALVQQIESGVELGPPAKAATAASSSADPEVSKKEYLALVSRVERLEALIEQLTRGASFPVEIPKLAATASSSSFSTVAHAPLLDSIPLEDLEVDFEDDEEPPKKKLSRPKKTTPTVESVTHPKRLAFSKPKVNQ